MRVGCFVVVVLCWVKKLLLFLWGIVGWVSAGVVVGGASAVVAAAAAACVDAAVAVAVVVEALAAN